MGIRSRQLFSILLAVVLAAFLAQVLAQSSSSSSKPKSVQSQASPTDAGSIVNDVYRNAGFGFTCKIPFGWVDRTEQMSDDSNQEAASNSNNAAKKSMLFLAVFERPPEVAGDSVNSTILVAAEPASSYPGLQNAAQYFGPLTELTKSKGLKVVNGPYDYPMDAKQFVRSDFSKPLGNLTLHQSTLVLMEKGYLVSFTFIGGTEDEVDELMEGLKFAGKESSPPPK
jgi:hypothetical protein